jgi:para-nitrobenzyl esterase
MTMKILHYAILCLPVTLSAAAQVPSCDGNRYKNFVFGTFDSTMNVRYGQNFTMNNVFQNLVMDIYQPGADTALKRPLILFIHGGGFVSGTRQDCRSLCLLFALKGFVTATNDYRLIDVPLTDSVTVAEGVVQAVSDAKAAVRFFVEDAATGNLFKIDTNYIFISGVSAGGVTASHVAYLDSTDIIPTYISELIAANGGFPGNSSTNTSHSAPIKGVINYSGALWRKEFISTGEPPLFSVHDTGDTIVPCNHGISDAYPFPVYIDGSCAMQQEANVKGVFNDILLNEGNGHCVYFFTFPLADTVIQKSADFLYNIICNNVLSVNDIDYSEREIRLFPNPADEKINAELPAILKEKLKIQIFNSMGRLLREIETNHSIQIDISDLPKGLYFIHFNNLSEQAQKFIKQ